MSHSRTIGIIGAGGIVFKSHLPLLRAIGADVRWILDVDKSRARAVSKAFDIPLALGATELELATPTDVVLLACPYGARWAYYNFLRHGSAAIYVEKPVARSVAELQRICELRPDYALAAGFLRRSTGVTNILKGVIQDGLFGHPRRIRCEFGTATVISSGGSFAKNVALAGGGQLFESAIHSIDAVCYMAGITRAVVRNCRMEADGQFDLHTDATIQLADTRGRDIELDLLVTCFHSTQYEIEIEFDQACVSFSLFTKKSPTVRAIDRRRSYQLLDSGLADYPRDVFDVMYVFWKDFLAGLDTRRPNYTSARSTVVTTSIMEQLYRQTLPAGERLETTSSAPIGS